MKRIFALLFGMLFCLNYAVAQETSTDTAPPTRYGIDISTSFVMGLPQNQFKTNFGQSVLPGVNFDFTFTPSKAIPFWKMGLQLESLFSINQKDDWYGMELKSSTDFVSINLLHRFLPPQSMQVKPFFELAFGLNFNFTSSSYEIYDKATFLEKLLFDEEDYSEVVTLKDHDDVAKNISVGAGLIIKNRVMLSLKYNYASDVVYVSPRSIIVQGNDIVYSYYNSPVKLISITLGFKLNSLELTRM